MTITLESLDVLRERERERELYFSEIKCGFVNCVNKNKRNKKIKTNREKIVIKPSL